LLGIEAALVVGAKGVEIDIQFSKDSEPFLFHDEDLQRVGGLSGSVFNFELNVLTKMSAHEPERFGDTFLPTPIPALVDVISIMRKYPAALLFVEIKEESFGHISREQIITKLATVLAPIAAQVVIISFDLAVLRLARATLSWPVGWVLTQYNEGSQLLASDFQPEFLICNQRKLPIGEPLWTGLWQWFMYDITDLEAATLLQQKGVSWVESWDAKALIAGLQNE
jgi:glycerophosphoryl diester phosphodiesterase